MTPDSRETLILKFAGDRVIAHQALFAHRHSDATPPFHDELTELWHSPAPKVLTRSAAAASLRSLRRRSCLPPP